jgi:hypothetical protein
MNVIRKDLNKIFARIKVENKSRRVKIKFRKVDGGYTVYFQYWNGFKHEYEFLREKFFGFDKTKIYDDDLLLEIEEVRIVKDNQSRKNEYFELNANGNIFQEILELK